MYVVEFVALVWAKSRSPSNRRDVPLIPSVSSITASSFRVTSSVLFSKFHSSVAFGGMLPSVRSNEMSSRNDKVPLRFVNVYSSVTVSL